MDSRVVSGTDTQLGLGSPSRSRRLIVSGLALLAVWWWSVPFAPPELWVWRILVSGLFLSGVPVAAALIAAGWSGLVGRSARGPIGIGFLVGMSTTIWFALVYTSRGAGFVYVIGSLVFFLAVVVAFFGPLMSQRVRAGTPRAPGTPHPGAEPTASAHEPRTPAFGVRAGSSMIDRQKDRSVGSVGPRLKVPVKRVASIAAIVLGTLMLLPFLMLVPDTIINRDSGCVVAPVGYLFPATSSDSGYRIDIDPESCVRTIVDRDGNPAPASVYEGTPVPYPSLRPPAYTPVAGLASWFAMTSLVLLIGIRGISSTRDRDRERLEWRAWMRHSRVLLAGGLFSLAVSFLATTGAFLTTFHGTPLSNTWDVLRLPWSVIIGVFVSAAVGMLFAASAVTRRTPVMRAFGVGAAVGVGELVLTIYVFTALLGSAYGFGLTPKTPSVVGTVVLDIWLLVGVLAPIGLAVGWVAARRGWHVSRWGAVGVLGATVLAVFIGGAGWIPFRYGQAPSWPWKCSEWGEAALSAAPSWVPSMPVEVLPPGIPCSSDG